MADLGRHAEAFIRPSPAGGTLGGVARRTREAVLLCEAAGFDVVLVETVGVGQSEVAVADLVDLFLLVASPAGGDELQGIKRGIMELADLIVVNKADGDLAPAAQRAAADLRHAVHLLRPKRPGWEVAVLTCSALNGTGIAELWDAIGARATSASGPTALDELRAEQSVAWMWSEVTDTLLQRLRDHPDVRRLAAELEQAVAAGEVAPAAAAQRMLDAFLGRGSSGLRAAVRTRTVHVVRGLDAELELEAPHPLERALRHDAVGRDEVGDDAEGEHLDRGHEQHAAEDDRLQVAGAVAVDDPVPQERRPRQRS